MTVGHITAGRVAFTALWSAVLVFLALPIIVVVLLSFSSASYLTFPPPSFGLRWYRAYLGSAEWLDSTWLSLEVAVCVVVLSTSLGTLAALGLVRLPARWRAGCGALILSPLIIPGIVASIGIYYVFAKYRLIGTMTGLVLAHTCLAVPFVVTSVTASLARFDRRLEQAALSLGATPWATFWQVTLPAIRPGVLVGGVFAFIVSFDELIVALFLAGSGAITLPRRMWDDLRFAIDPTIAAVSTLTIAVIAIVLIGSMLAGRGPAQSRTGAGRSG